MTNRDRPRDRRTWFAPARPRRRSLALLRWLRILSAGLLLVLLGLGRARAQPSPDVTPDGPSAPASGATVTGRVVDASGAPLAGATVTIASPATTVAVTTDADGRYTVLLSAEGSYRATTTREGYVTDERPILVELGRPYTLAITLGPAPPAPAPPTVIAGTILDEQGAPVPAATVSIKDTTYAAIADASGHYELQVPSGGTYALEAVLVGYTTALASVTVATGAAATAPITMRTAPDLLSLGEVVMVTSAGSGRSKLEAGEAIATLDEAYVRKIGARSTADVFKSIPGVFVESSGGEGNANIRVRGLPAPGGGKFTQLQEDGLEVTPYGDISFGNSDNFVRTDGTVARIEGVRGGSSSIRTSNAPGGLINLISKTGGEPGGSIAQTLGLSFPLYRLDADYGSPITDTLRFHVGGFYRTDDGVRSPGFTANVGGQIKANVTRTFEHGYVRVYMKYLNDRNISYLQIPLTRKSDSDDTPVGIPGFDPHFGTLPSRDLLRLRATTPSGEQVDDNLAQGMNPNVTALGAESEYDIGDGWTLSERFRYSDIKNQFNGIFPFAGNPVGPDELARSRNLSSYAYSYASGRGAGTELSADELAGLNGNGLVTPYGWWAVSLPIQGFTNKLELVKQLTVRDGITIRTALGYDHNHHTLSSVWWWHTVLTDVSDNTRRLNLVDTATGTPITSDGVLQYGSLYRNYWADTTIDAPYLTFDVSPVKPLVLTGGVRYDWGRTRGAAEKVASYDYDVNRDGVIASAERGVQYGTGQDIPFNYAYHGLSYAISANYLLTKDQAVFAGTNMGRRAPADRTYGGSATEDTRSGLPPGTKIERVFQSELGYKLRTDQLGLFATAFYSAFPDFSFTDFETNPVSGAVESVTRFARVATLGLELESAFQYRELSIQCIGTLQRTRFARFTTSVVDPDGTLQNVDYTGNTVPGSPALYYQVRPEYRVGRWGEISVTAHGNTRKWQDNANRQPLPGYVQIDASASVHLTRKLDLTISASNLLNTIGLDEGNPRAAQLTPVGNLFFGRPIPGRSAIATLRYTL